MEEPEIGPAGWAMAGAEAGAVGQAGADRGRAWYRSETRKAIVDAARSLVSRDGVDKFSLVRVAEAAQFAPPAVYSYFASKTELLTAVVAEDLAALASSLRDPCPDGAASAHGDCEPDGVPHEPPVADGPPDLGAATGASAANAPYQDGPCTEEMAAELAAQATLRDASPSEDAPSALREMSGDAESHSDAPQSCPVTADARPVEELVLELQKRVEQVEARRADPWLERRLREFERMLTTLDERSTAMERGLPAASAPLDADIQDLRIRVEAVEKKQEEIAADKGEALLERIDAAQAQQRQMWGDLRTLVLEQSGRLEVLERDRNIHPPAMQTPPPASQAEASVIALHEIVANASAPGDAAASPDVAPAAAAEPAKPDPDGSYIAAARRAAQAAQTLNQTHETKGKSGGRSRRLMLGLCIAAGITVVVTGFALKIATSSANTAPAHVPAASQMVHRDRVMRGGHAADAMDAALAGNARAKARMGLAFLEGKGAPQDDKRAASWLSAAASSGDPIAQYALGVMFEHGRGEAKDETEAVRWYQAAAEKGNLKAAYRLAICYAEGWGISRDYAQAARWFSKAADSGQLDAQYNLAVLYERGLGVPQSLMVAYKWYALAARQNDQESAARIDALASQMSADDLAAARAAAAGFVPTKGDPDANTWPTLADGNAQQAFSIPRNG